MNERKAKPEHGEEVLLDALIDFTDDEELQFSESVVYAYIGLHLTGTCESLSFFFFLFFFSCFCLFFYYPGHGLL